MQAMARTRAASGNFKPNDDYEKMQFYYHPDHLGSTSYITNLDGEVSQHIEYVLFGEVFIEERNNTWNTPYLFNAKEFDEETGMYYYGARYYEPRLSLWMSCDPMQEKYAYITPYCYTFDNPVKYIDPTGEDGEITGTGTEKDPFIIKANYYYEKGSLNEQQIKGLNNAISEYNNKGKVRKIKNDDGTKSYVRFNISAEEVEKGKLTTAIMNDFITNEGGQDIFFGNSLGTRANEGSNNTDLGSANGYRVDINQSSIDNFARNNHVDKDDLIKWTYVHEIGHNHAIRQVGTFPTSKCCHGRNKNNIFKENLSMQILETKGRKMNKIKREERENLHTFSDTTFYNDTVKVLTNYY